MALASDYTPERDPRRHSARGRARHVRAEPAIAIPSEALDTWRRDRDSPIVPSFHDSDATLARRPAEPLDAGRTARSVVSPKSWSNAVIVSLVFHAAIALFFIAIADDEVLIAGGEQAQVALLGSAPEDQVSAGNGVDSAETDVTSVTLVTMLKANPVETVDRVAVPVETVVDTVKTAPVAELVQAIETALVEPVTETVEPVKAEASARVEAPAAEPVEPTPEIAEASPAPAEVTPVPPAELPRDTLSPAPPSSIFPDVLTAERPDPVDDNVVPLQAVPALVSPVEPVETIQAPDTAEPVEPASPTEALRPVEQVATVEPLAEPEPVAPKKQVAAKPKPVKAKPAPAAKEAPKKVARADTPRKAVGKPADKPGKKASRAGSKGNNESDARRGDAEGSAEGRNAARSKGGKRNSAAGNAAVSNYPGKIVSKLRRALRYPAQAKREKLRGEVQVAFTVSAAGGVGSIRVVRSSGSPVLDKAAVDTVRRAAPFPAIPEGAGRSSWPFSVPLAFMR